MSMTDKQTMLSDIFGSFRFLLLNVSLLMLLGWAIFAFWNRYDLHETHRVFEIAGLRLLGLAGPETQPII